MTKRRVVVTGIGMVTPLGNDVETSWQSVLSGISGVTSYEHYDGAGELPTRIYAGIKDFDPKLYLSSKDIKKFDDFILYAYAGAKQAIEDSGIVITEELSHRAGAAIGSGIGGLGFIERSHKIMNQSGPRKISPFFIPGSIINMAPGLVSMNFNLKGPTFSTVSACTTGAHNIGEAARHIQYGNVDVMVAGGAEKGSTPLGMVGFSSVKALSTRNDEPTKASRPWDKDRDGFVLGDGAGMVVLEEYEHAKQRGAKIYAELIGYGLSSDAYHITSPSGEGAINCMNNALNDAKINNEQIDYINAHGTSTPVGDLAEADSVKKVFGEHAYNLSISSTKSMTGHLLGATGAVEAIFSILAMNNDIAPPTINLDNPSDGCDLDFVAHNAKEREINTVMSNSFGFGGTNASLIFGRL